MTAQCSTAPMPEAPPAPYVTLSDAVKLAAQRGYFAPGALQVTLYRMQIPAGRNLVFYGFVYGQEAEDGGAFATAFAVFAIARNDAGALVGGDFGGAPLFVNEAVVVVDDDTVELRGDVAGVLPVETVYAPTIEQADNPFVY